MLVHDRLLVVVVEPVVDPGKDLVDPIDQISDDLGIGDQGRRDGQAGVATVVGTDGGTDLTDEPAKHPALQARLLRVAQSDSLVPVCTQVDGIEEAGAPDLAQTAVVVDQVSEPWEYTMSHRWSCPLPKCALI